MPFKDDNVLVGVSANRHTVDLDELLAWMADEEHGSITYAASSREPKCLEVRLSGGYRVRHGNKTVYDGTDGRAAVTAYNKI